MVLSLVFVEPKLRMWPRLMRTSAVATSLGKPAAIDPRHWLVSSPPQRARRSRARLRPSPADLSCLRANAGVNSFREGSLKLLQRERMATLCSGHEKRRGTIVGLLSEKSPQASVPVVQCYGENCQIWRDNLQM